MKKFIYNGCVIAIDYSGIFRFSGGGLQEMLRFLISAIVYQKHIKILIIGLILAKVSTEGIEYKDFETEELFSINFT